MAKYLNPTSWHSSLIMKVIVQNPSPLSGNHLFTKSNLEIKLNKPGYYEICDHKCAKGWQRGY